MKTFNAYRSSVIWELVLMFFFVTIVTYVYSLGVAQGIAFPISILFSFSVIGIGTAVKIHGPPPVGILSMWKEKNMLALSAGWIWSS